MGGQPILFPSSALDKKEDLQDVIGYLNNWANLLVVRHRDMAALEKSLHLHPYLSSMR